MLCVVKIQPPSKRSCVCGSCCLIFTPSRGSQKGLDWLTEASHFSANGGAHMANENRSLDVRLMAPHSFGWRSARLRIAKNVSGQSCLRIPVPEGIGGPRQPLCYVGNVPSEINTACHGGYCSYDQCHHDHVHGGPTASSSSKSRFADRSSRWNRND